MEPERPDPRPPIESTMTLLRVGKAGDHAALERLYVRYLPRLTRWAMNRLPATARHFEDTQDLVQEVLVKFITEKVHDFDPQHPGALMAYLRTAVHRKILDHIRKEGRSPKQEESVPEDLKATNPSPFDDAVAADAVERYEASLAELNDRERAVVILRVELVYSNAEIAEELSFPTEDAARMFTNRAVLKLGKVMAKKEGA